jgi:capsular exopolysaccharide synthesis family protein
MKVWQVRQNEMSRFYEALKQAGGGLSRSLGTAGDDSLDALWPAAPDTSVGLQGDAAQARSIDADHKADQWPAIAEDMLAEVGRPDGGLGYRALQALRAAVRIDRNARLLPNTEDVTIIEHYRRLRTKLIQEHEAKPFRTLLVTSPAPQEGKTVTVLNLALSFAMLSNFKVLVIDADMRRGSLGKWLGVVDRPGLSNLMDGSASLEDVVLKCDEIPIYFMVSGTSERPAAELLLTSDLGAHFRKIAAQFDLVLVDSPPTSLITDAHLLARACDAVLLVARAFTTTQKALQSAVHDLQPRRIIGTVLNAGTRTRSRQYREYYHSARA